MEEFEGLPSYDARSRIGTMATGSEVSNVTSCGWIQTKSADTEVLSFAAFIEQK